MTMEFGALSLADLQQNIDTGAAATAADRIDEIVDARRVLGGLDRFYGQVDWGGLPRRLVEASFNRFATEIAPAVHAALAS